MLFIFRILNHILVVFHLVDRYRQHNLVVIPVERPGFFGNLAQVVLTLDLPVVPDQVKETLSFSPELYAALLQYQIQGDGLVRQIIQILTRTCVDRL